MTRRHLKKDAMVTLYMCIFLLCVRKSSSTHKICKMANEKMEINNESECFELPNSNVKLDIRQIQLEFHHHWITHYTFYFPEVTLNCECTCDVDKNYCTLNTMNKQNVCDKHQTFYSTCSNLEYRGTGVCSKHHKVCCQVYFSIRKLSLQSQYQAYQLQLSKQSYRFQVNVTSQQKNLTFMWSISTWIKSIIIDETTTLNLDISKDIGNSFDLSNHWIYYSDQTETFYTDVPINDHDRIDLDKIGWFRRNRDNDTMERIARTSLETRLHLQLQKCNDNIPQFTWTLDATNYYKENNLNSIFQGETLSEIYGDQWSVEKADFFSGKPAFILTTKQAPATTVTVSQTSKIVKMKMLKIEQSPQKVTLEFNNITEGRYAIIIVDNTVENQLLQTFTIDSSTAFPLYISSILRKDPSFNSIICAVLISKKTTELCVSMHQLIPIQMTNIKQKNDFGEINKRPLQMLTNNKAETPKVIDEKNSSCNTLKTEVWIYRIVISVCLVCIGVMLFTKFHVKRKND